ncbi:hypothetical protein ATY79_22985 [Rhizobium sp. R693]|nr:hypothetical protein ATY79_22985 [Rhizobium sp. R693]
MAERSMASVVVSNTTKSASSFSRLDRGSPARLPEQWKGLIQLAEMHRRRPRVFVTVFFLAATLRFFW